MNRYFGDSVYYLRQAAATASKGVRKEAAPVASSARALLGREREPEPTRLEQVEHRVADVREAIARRAQRVVDRVRPRRV